MLKIKLDHTELHAVASHFKRIHEHIEKKKLFTSDKTEIMFMNAELELCEDWVKLAESKLKRDQKSFTMPLFLATALILIKYDSAIDAAPYPRVVINEISDKAYQKLISR